MNKKFFLGMFAAAGMLMATSCSNDDLIEQGSGDMATVSFSLTTEGAPMSRAISDGKSANELWYAVFDAEGTRISTIKQVKEKQVAFPAKETLLLAKGQTYKVAFWAQNKDCEAYEVDDNMNVEVSYENATNNDEKRDAFFKTVEFTVNGDASIDVELKRPFAQINVGITDEDYQKAKESDIEIEKSSVTIKKAATSINLLTGKTTGETEAVFNLAKIPDESLQKVKINGTEKDYTWLSMSYFLVADGSESGADKANLESVAFTFKPKSGKDIKFSEGLTEVPVQRNYRTNIVGRILTGSIDFNISIDKEYDNDHNYPGGSIEQQLEFAAKCGGTVTLTKDVDVATNFMVYKDMTINLNGYRLKYTGENAIFMRIFDKATLTINGDENSSIESKGYIASANQGGKITVNGGCYKADITCFQANGGQVYINGGVFETTNSKYGSVYLLNHIDGKKEEGKIEVKGGKFKDYDPAHSKSENPEMDFVAKGYKSIQIDDWYYVVPNTTDLVTATQLKDILTASNNVTLDKDYVVTGEWTSLAKSGDWTIDGAGHSISGLTKPLLAGNAANNLTIKNLTIANSTIGQAADENGLGTGAFACFMDATASATFENCHLVKSRVTGSERAAGLIAYSSTAPLDIKDCSVEECTITAVGGTGGLVGYTMATTTVSNSKVTGSTIKSTEDRTEKTALAGSIIGTVNANTTLANVTSTGNTVTNVNTTPYSEKVGRVLNGTLTDN